MFFLQDGKIRRLSFILTECNSHFTLLTMWWWCADFKLFASCLGMWINPKKITMRIFEHHHIPGHRTQHILLCGSWFHSRLKVCCMIYSGWSDQKSLRSHFNTEVALAILVSSVAREPHWFISLWTFRPQRAACDCMRDSLFSLFGLNSNLNLWKLNTTHYIIILEMNE